MLRFERMIKKSPPTVARTGRQRGSPAGVLTEPANGASDKVVDATSYARRKRAAPAERDGPSLSHSSTFSARRHAHGDAGGPSRPSIGGLQDIVRALRANGVALKATEQPIDTSTAAGKCFLDMLGVFAEFETNLRKERQMEGIAKAKAAGVYRGRKPGIDPAEVRKMLGNGKRPSEVAKILGISRASVYRVAGRKAA
jgi:hypothetical protein